MSTITAIPSLLRHFHQIMLPIMLTTRIPIPRLPGQRSLVSTAKAILLVGLAKATSLPTSPPLLLHVPVALFAIWSLIYTPMIRTV